MNQNSQRIESILELHKRCRLLIALAELKLLKLTLLDRVRTLQAEEAR